MLNFLDITNSNTNLCDREHIIHKNETSAAINYTKSTNFMSSHCYSCKKVMSTFLTKMWGEASSLHALCNCSTLVKLDLTLWKDTTISLTFHSKANNMVNVDMADTGMHGSSSICKNTV